MKQEIDRRNLSPSNSRDKDMKLSSTGEGDLEPAEARGALNPNLGLIPEFSGFSVSPAVKTHFFT